MCIPSTSTQLCQNLDNMGSQVICETVETKIDCALKVAQGAADIGIFSAEETLLVAHQFVGNLRVAATIRDVSRSGPFAFEAVAVVPSNHNGGLDGLRGGKYCHPGFDQNEQLWSPRVLKAFEVAVARTDQCPDANTDRKTAEEMEVDTLSRFFSSACRPGPWSANSRVDNDLRNRYPSLCSLCGENANCSRYTINMGASVAGIQQTNRHIQALECLRSNNNGAVAYVAWQHVQEFFTIRNPQDASSFALLCEDGSLRVLTTAVLSSVTAPCAFVKQPWSTIVTSASSSAAIQTNMRNWWPNGASPGGNSWQSVLFNAVIGGANARVSFEDGLPTTQNFTESFRNIPIVPGSSSCIPAHRWCTISAQEHTKCLWLRNAAYLLGIVPTITCQQSKSVFDCLNAIRNNFADFTVTVSNYGFISRQHYRLSPVKLVQNSRSDPLAITRVAALLRESSTQSITRFENLRGRKACFPEFGGIAFLAFLRAAQETSTISSSDCDYTRAVGEFFDSACAPGAIDITQRLTESTYNATKLCSLCRSSKSDEDTCHFDRSNLYYDNSGSIMCLADPNSDVAFVDLQNIDAHLSNAGLQPTDVRILCRNNTLAATTGVSVDQNCLLAVVVDAEVHARRNDPVSNSLNSMLDALDRYFGYSADNGAQLINLGMYSSFNGINNLIFKNTAIGLSEPSSEATSEQIRDYVELFQHLESCTGSTTPVPGLATRNFFSIVTLIVTSLVCLMP